MRWAASVSRAVACMVAAMPLAMEPALACSIIVLEEPSPAEKRRQARLLIEQASAIIDGEVVRPFVRGQQPALVRAVRVLKGPQQEYFEVGERDSCDSALDQIGWRMRLVLFGGPDLYFFPIRTVDDRYVDRQLRSDRRGVWPYRGQ